MQFMKKIARDAIHKFKDAVDNNLSFSDYSISKLINFKHTRIVCTYSISTGIPPSTSANANSKTSITNSYLQYGQYFRIEHGAKTDVQIGRETKSLMVRQLMLDTSGMTCPFASPEGKNVGLQNFQVLLLVITNGDVPIFEFIDIFQNDCILLQNATPFEIFNMTKIFINGIWKWLTNEPEKLEKKLRKLKRSGDIGIYTCIYHDCKEKILYIDASEGKFVSPKFVVKSPDKFTNHQSLKINKNKIHFLNPLVNNNQRKKEKKFHPLITNWDHLVYQGNVEFISTNEVCNKDYYVAESFYELNKLNEINKQIIYKWCDIHPLNNLSVIASTHNFDGTAPTTRKSYAISMQKQSIGATSGKSDKNIHHICYKLQYPEYPLVMPKTKFKIHPLDKDGITQNVFCLVMTDSNNPEDSISFSQSFIQRGGGRMSIFRKDEMILKLNESKNSNNQTIFKKPTNQTKGYDYSNLDEDGLPIPGTRLNSLDKVNLKSDYFVKDGVILETNSAKILNYGNSLQPEIIRKNEKGQSALFGIVNKKQITTSDGGQTKLVEKDCSKPFKKCEAYVLSVLRTNDESSQVAQVISVIQKQPVVGDKVCNSAGQKNVISAIKPDEELPFTHEGIKPDVIFNSHGFPSRMTTGQMLYMAYSVACAVNGVIGDGTSFEYFNHQDIYELLEQSGLNKFSYYTVYDGITGEKYPGQYFGGFLPIQFLKHMAQLKEHARGDSGPINSITHQPTQGKKEDGGIKYGEMEKNCILAWGAFQVLHSLHENSDLHNFWLCDNCKKLGYLDQSTGKPVCITCGDTETSFYKVSIPWSAVTMLKELEALNISIYLYCTDEQIQREMKRRDQLQQNALNKSF